MRIPPTFCIYKNRYANPSWNNIFSKQSSKGGGHNHHPTKIIFLIKFAYSVFTGVQICIILDKNPTYKAYSFETVGNSQIISENLKFATWKKKFSNFVRPPQLNMDEQSTLFLRSMLPQYMAFSVCVCQKKCQATSKVGRRLRFGMLTVLTNIISTKVLHHASCIKLHASCIIHCR